MNLRFDPISSSNLNQIIQVQANIFPDESAEQNYLDTLEHNPYRKQLANWLVFKNKTPIGIIGLYSYHQYPLTSWLGWFGVLKKYRGKGYGSSMFDFWLSFSKSSGYTEARLYTDKYQNQEAVAFYQRKFMIQEDYTNPLESKEISDSTLIFSLSLTHDPIEKWNNKYLELTEQLEKQSRELY